MSFALEFRKKQQLLEHAVHSARQANKGFVSMPAERSSDTKGNRRRVLLALVIAGGVLATFNSGGLVQYSYDLADSPFGENVIEASESWHDMMSETRVTEVMDQIRGSVAMARESSWQDLTFGFASVSAESVPDSKPQPLIVPASGEPLPKLQEHRAPEPVEPSGPVMKASARPAYPN